MKLITDAAWFRALRGLRRRRAAGPDAGDMGTAFGLDAITVVDRDDSEFAAPRPLPAGDTPAARDWQRRVARRSRF